MGGRLGRGLDAGEALRYNLEGDGICIALGTGDEGMMWKC